MSITTPARLIVLAIALHTMLPAAAAKSATAPADSAHAKAKLAVVRSRIAGLTHRLADELKERDAQSARLRDAELAVTAKREALEAIHGAARDAQMHGGELAAEQQSTEAQLRTERAALAEQMRRAYRIGTEEDLKLMLNQRDPASVGRMLAYHRYFAAQRSARIEAVQAHIERLATLESQIAEERARLAELEQSASREMAGLEAARQQRAMALAALTQRVASGSQELSALKREEQAVESLVRDLARMLKDLPADSSQSFAALRGKLPWPLIGRITAPYQGPGTSSLGPRRNGETLEGERGAKVHAVYFGRVVYADWLQGIGLLLIVAHSGGYMTLYGHAEVLYKSVGDWVAPGDVIAALNDAPGSRPELYFEIRAQRTPLDPRLWLRPAP